MKIKKLLLLTVSLGFLTPLVLADWSALLNSTAWMEWLASNPITKSNVAQADIPNAQEKVQEVQVAQSDNSNDSVNTETKKIDFYESLGIELVPEIALTDPEPKLKATLIQLIEEGKYDDAVAYFVSIERKNHKTAISILETLDANYRHIILMESPEAFITKILLAMRTDFKGKTLRHWGPFELKSAYFGKRIEQFAEIKGDSVSLRYILFFLYHNLPQQNLSTDEQHLAFERVAQLCRILSHATDESLVSLLVYTKEEASVKMGKEHKSCFGAVEKKGFCDEETPIYFPADLLGSLMTVMHQQNYISLKAIVSIIEKEFEIDSKRGKTILKDMKENIIQSITLNLSEEVLVHIPYKIKSGDKLDNNNNNIFFLEAGNKNNSSKNATLESKNKTGTLTIEAEEDDDESKKEEL